MSWREQLREASWKGLKFFVQTTGLEGGWEIDLKNIPVGEINISAEGSKEAQQKIIDQKKKDAVLSKATDTSRNAKIHSVTMHFIGDNYIDERNAMLKLLDAGGQGDLILPTFGKIKAIAGQYRTDFDNTVGGFETLEVPFYEVSREPQVTSRVDTATQLEDSATAAKDEVEESFGYSATTPTVPGIAPSVFDPEPSADFVLDAAEAVANALPDSLFNEIGLGEANDLVNGYVKDLDDFRDKISVIVRKPFDYIEEIRSITQKITTIFDAPIDGFNAAKRIFNRFGAEFDDVFGTTPDREQERLNQESVVFSVKAIAAIQMSVSAAQVQFETSVDVTPIIDDVVNSLDSLALEVGNSTQRQELFDSLNDVKTKFLADISSAAADLPGIKNITTNLELPSVVIAYDLYADAERQDEIIERNNIVNPLFSNKNLEVLSF